MFLLVPKVGKGWGRKLPLEVVGEGLEMALSSDSEGASVGMAMTVVDETLLMLGRSM